MSQELLGQLFANEVEVVLSPVVIAEAQRQAAETAAASSDEVAAVIAAVTRRHAISPDAHTMAVQPLRDAISTTGSEALAPLLAHPACRVAEWPDVSAKELVRRELERRPPTSLKDGQSTGLRDTIIWHGLLELHGTLEEHDEILFVTNDKGFLKDGDLAPELRAELEASEWPDADQVRVTSRLENALVEVRQQRQLITAREGLIRNAVIDYLASLEGDTWSRVDTTNTAPLPFGVEEAMISAVDAITVINVSLGAPSRADASAEVTVSAFMRTDEYIQEHADEVDWMHGELDEPMIGVDFSLTLSIEAEVEIDSSGEEEEAWVEEAVASWSR